MADAWTTTVTAGDRWILRVSMALDWLRSRGSSSERWQMPDFGSLDLIACPVCGRKDRMKFVRWTRSKVQPLSPHPNEVLLTLRSPAEVIFTCTSDNSINSVKVPDSWRPPAGLISR